MWYISHNDVHEVNFLSRDAMLLDGLQDHLSPGEDKDTINLFSYPARVSVPIGRIVLPTMYFTLHVDLE